MSKTFGVLVAAAVAGLGAAAIGATPAAAADAAKACYRKHCGKSIQGHEGMCGGTRVTELGDQKSCEAAGGAWTTAAEAEAFKKKD